MKSNADRQRSAAKGPPPAPERAPAVGQEHGIGPPFWSALALLLAGHAAFWILLPNAAEDAYITFRYAQNLATGLGLVFNPGEQVMGFSSPLWTLWTALGVWISGNPTLWTRSWSLLADVVTLFLLTRILGRFGSRASVWCGTLFFAVWPYFAATSVSGMEVNVMLTLITLAAWLVLVRSAWSGVVLGLLTLTRPEGIACAAVITIWARQRDRLIGAGLLALGLAALWLYYGSPVPQSMLAKAEIYGTPGPWAGRAWWEWLAPFELGRWPVTQEGLQLFMIRVLLTPACLLGLWKLRRSSGLMFPAACLAAWLGYAVLGVVYFWWYLLVPLAGFVFLAALGLPELLRGKWVYVTLGLLLLGTWTTQPYKIYVGRATHEARLFSRVAELLAQRASPGQTVLLEPIGFIGFAVPSVRILDETGLVTPEAARRRRQGSGWYADLVRERRPDWLVVRHGVLKNLIPYAGIGAPFRGQAELDSIRSRYDVVLQTSSDPTNEDLLVLKRNR